MPMITDDYYSFPKILVEGKRGFYWDKFSKKASLRNMINYLKQASYYIGVAYHVMGQKAQRITIFADKLIMIEVLKDDSDVGMYKL